MINLKIKTIIIYILISLLLIIFTVGICLSFNFEKHMDYELSSFKDNIVEANYLSVVDLYGWKNNKSMFSLFRESDSLERMKNMNADLNSHFNYWEIYSQPLEIMRLYTLDPKFCVGYEQGEFEELINQEIVINGKETYCTPIKAVEIGRQAYIDLKLKEKLNAGSSFDETTLSIASMKDNIPVILGYDYKEYFSEGSLIEANYLSIDCRFEVIGFFNEETYIPEGYDTLFLDRYVVIPFFDLADPMDNQEIESYGDKIYYSLKNCGFIRYDKQDEEQVRFTFGEICKKYDLLFHLIDPQVTDRDQMYNEYAMLKQFKKNAFYITFILYIFVFLFIVYLLIKNINENRNKFAVYFLCGANEIRILKELMLSMFLLFGVSLIGSVFVILIIMNKISVSLKYSGEIILFVTLLYFVFILILLGITHFILKRCNFGMYLREE